MNKQSRVMRRFLEMTCFSKIPLMLILLILFDSCSNQSPNGSTMNIANGVTNNHKFNKDVFVKGCIAYAKQDKRNKIADVESYCQCMAEKIEQNQNDTGFVNRINGLDQSGSNVSNMEELFSIPKMKVLINECVQESMVNNPEAKMPVATSEERKALIRQFKQTLSAQDYQSLKEFVNNIDSFCGCYIDKVYQQFTIREMQAKNFGSNPARQQILNDCLLKNKK